MNANTEKSATYRNKLAKKYDQKSNMSLSKERRNKEETYEFSNFGSSFADFSEIPKHCESF